MPLCFIEPQEAIRVVARGGGLAVELERLGREVGHAEHGDVHGGVVEHHLGVELLHLPTAHGVQTAATAAATAVERGRGAP